MKFFLYEVSEKTTPAKIYLRIIVDRKKAEIRLSHSIPPLNWDDEKQRSKTDKSLNEELAFIENKIFEFKRQLQYQDKEITALGLKNLFLGKESDSEKHIRGLIPYYEQFIKKCKENSQEYSDVLIGKHQNSLNKIKEFLLLNKQADIELDKINYQWLKAYDHHLMTYRRINRANPSRTEKPLCRNTTNKQHDWLRTVLLSAQREGIITNYPYRDLILKDTPTVREFLVEEEIEALKIHPLSSNESLKRVRDIFIFSIYTGLRFSDAMSLTSDNIVLDKDGRLWINKIQEKTNERVMIPILKQAQDIVDRYKPHLITNRILPSISNQKLNSYLKTIADIVGIRKKLTHHIARHTFATTITLSNEIPVEIVSKWLGHTSIKTTQIYAKVTSQYLGKIANKLDQKLT